MDRSKLPKRDKNSKSIWERMGFTSSQRTVKTKKDPGRRAGSYMTSKESKKNVLDRAGDID